ncbi:MAG TPA: DUF2934 domain-containing protein [Bryobacteraceae bacterium]|nr:DUF2934 domain-containing protein [Bryobacteraceae bacterium]
MPKAQAAATSATGAVSSPARQSSEVQADTNKSTNTQVEKTREGRSASSSVPSAGEGPAGLAATDEKAQDGNADGQDRVQIVAYQLWLDRGCPDGSPEVDWIEAVRICRNAEA